MSQIVTDSQHYSNIATAIRRKLGVSESYKPSEMAAAVEAIQAGGTLQEKTVTPSASDQTVTSDAGYAGLYSVNVLGDADLLAGYIKKGVTIFGVEGAYEEHNEDIVLNVEKVVQDTYAGETTYTGEEFIVINVYPKTYGTVTVTYGGLTKTITDTSGAEKPNAQTISFGTLYGVPDEAETPASGTMIIKGDYATISHGTYATKKSNSNSATCIKEILNFGKINELYMSSLVLSPIINTKITIPATVKVFGKAALYGGNLSTVIVEGAPDMECSPYLTSPIKVARFLSIVPPKLIPGEDKDGNVLYDFFGDEEDEGFALEKIIVPKGYGEVYKTFDEVWARYASYIVEES